MPRRAAEKTPAQIRALRHPGGGTPVRYVVGGVPGLCIKVQPSGAKSWLLRGRFGEWEEQAGKRRSRKKRDIGIGPYPEILPGAARERARELRETFAAGRDPVVERRAAAVASATAARLSKPFRAVFEEYGQQKTQEFSTEKYRLQWESIV